MLLILFFQKEKILTLIFIEESKGIYRAYHQKGLHPRISTRGGNLIPITMKRIQHNKLPRGELGTKPTNTIIR